MNSEYLCNLIVPGAAKSGTSTLHDALNQHPEICMSDSKEPHYFCRFERNTKGPKHHNSLFSQVGGESVFGESSTSYMPWPDAIERISKDLENPKIIIVLRDPISRTFSHWRWRVKLGLEKRSLLQAIKLDGYGYDPEKPDGYGYMAYLQFSNYSKYCPLWIEKFGKENVPDSIGLCVFMDLRSPSAKVATGRDTGRAHRAPVSGSAGASVIRFKQESSCSSSLLSHHSASARSASAISR